MHIIISRLFICFTLFVMLSTLLVSSTAAAAAAPLSASSMITRSGASLMLDGKPFSFTGLNAYSLTTHWDYNTGCGPMFSDVELDAFFASLRPNSIVRTWAFQSLAFNKHTGTHDFAGIDRVVRAAERHGQRLILTIGNHWADCDDTQLKTEAWYANGYRTAFNPHGVTPLSYWQYVQRIVSRYAASPAIAMWEPMNEPETTTNWRCSPTSYQTLRTFLDTIGAEIKRLDPDHLVSSGVIGEERCGTQGDEYQRLHESPMLDVASYHDYGADTQPMPGDSWSGLQLRINQMKAAGKPLIVSEIGIKAQDNIVGCMSRASRRDKMKVKMDAQFAAGVAGFIPWNFMPSNGGECDYETISGDDPLIALLRAYQPPSGVRWWSLLPLLTALVVGALLFGSMRYRSQQRH